jgi:glycosyltransferase involved in cell wall biosynthesis
MKVSVIIPTYYRPKDLSELFESLLKQTVKPLEVIVVDDTPSNIIEELCAKHRDKFRSLILNLFMLEIIRNVPRQLQEILE